MQSPHDCQPVTFHWRGVELAGGLRIPISDLPAPALVFTGPFTGVKEQVTGHYAERLARRGYVTLAFDHRNFGASGGEPRQHEDSAAKLHDLLTATSFLADHDAVDAGRIGCVGICLGASYPVRHTAFDPRIKVLALVAGGCNSPALMRSALGNDAYRQVLGDLAERARHELHTGEIEYIPAVDGSGGEAAMGGQEPFDYYGTMRSASPRWANRVTRLSIRELLTFDAISAGAFVAPRPTLMVHGRIDDYCTPANAKAMFEHLEEPKRLMWLDTTNHIDLYDNPRFVDPAVAAIDSWLAEHLTTAPHHHSR
ncbi:alpha/beta hydrolase [soil metagenome]